VDLHQVGGMLAWGFWIFCCVSLVFFLVSWVFLPILWGFGLVFWSCFFCKMRIKSSKMEQKKAHFVVKMSLGVEMTINN